MTTIIGIWIVTVDGLPMAHGPIRDDADVIDRGHPERMAAIYQNINPGSDVRVEREMR